MDDFQANGVDSEYCPSDLHSTSLTLPTNFKPSATKRNRPRKNSKKRSQNTECVFCKNKGQPEAFYRSHSLKDPPSGCVTCPILRMYTCPICKASGDVAHTIKYCPFNVRIIADGTLDISLESSDEDAKDFMYTPNCSDTSSPVSLSSSVGSYSPPTTHLAQVTKPRKTKRFLQLSECAFCRNNGEAKHIYRSHTLRNPVSGLVTCPVLKGFTCPRCRSTGDRAHTIKYCPLSQIDRYVTW